MKRVSMFEELMSVPCNRIEVLVGLPGMGKTELRKRMLTEVHKLTLRTFVASTDDMLLRLADETSYSYNDMWASMIGAASRYVETAALAFWRMRNNREPHVLIWDQTNLSAKKRRAIMKMADDGYVRTWVAQELLDMSDKTEAEREFLIDKLVNRCKDRPNPIQREVIAGMVQTFIDAGGKAQFDGVPGVFAFANPTSIYGPEIRRLGQTVPGLLSQMTPDQLKSLLPDPL